jgi:hypothetical protein
MVPINNMVLEQHGIVLEKKKRMIRRCDGATRMIYLYIEKME